MGCVSSKHFTEEHERERVIRINSVSNELVNHVVSLTSSTYGALTIDAETETGTEQEAHEETVNENVLDRKKLESSTTRFGSNSTAWSMTISRPLSARNEPEIINASELMKGLEDVDNSGRRSPFKLLFNQTGSPRKSKMSAGKENMAISANEASFYTPMKAAVGLTVIKDSAKCDSSRLSPLFDPELVALYEKELSEEEEQIKRIISQSTKPKRSRSSNSTANSVLDSFERKSLPGGENSVVIYTTTLRGIRKTFEDCNTVRSIMESHEVRTYERDVSMDSGYKEELRKVMGTNEVKVPVVFVKGRLIGGVDQVVKLEEEGKLGGLFDGIGRALKRGCEVCGGIRFVMCMECNGSCKILDEELKKRVRCGECNENGLVQCPVCCLVGTC